MEVQKDVKKKDSTRVLLASLPIALSYSSTILYESVDLIYLSSYSSEAFAALFPSFVVWWNILALFSGTGKYVRVMMGNEIGAGRPEKVGQLLWLGFILAAIAVVPFTLMALLSTDIFALIGHSEVLQQQEVAYFEIMCCAAFFQVARIAFESLYMAAGRQTTILIIEGVSIAVHICLAPLLIFGLGMFPELGIRGAAVATLVASIVGFVIYCVVAKTDQRLKQYRVFAPLRFDPSEFARLLKIGVPSGVERFLEELSWSVLILMIGQFGVFALALSNVAINILELAYFPMVALGEVLSVEVAVRMGAGTPARIHPLMKSILFAVLIYVGVWVASLTVFSDFIVSLYFSGLDVSDVGNVNQIYRTYFAILCCCILFGSFYFIYNSALVGFHDTSFPMAVTLISFLLVFCVPTYYGLMMRGMSFLWGWGFFLVNFALLALVNRSRYHFMHARALPAAAPGMQSA